MRLQLSLAALLPILGASTASAVDQNADVRFNVYADEELSVLNQSGQVALESPEGLRGSAHVGVDIISGATRSFLPDAITSATRVDETRLEGGVRLGGNPLPGLRLDGGYVTSWERDYWSHAASLSAVTELFDRRGTLSVTGTFGFDNVGRAGYPSFSEQEGRGGIEASYAHALGKATSFTGLLFVEHALCGERRGCDASPYRYVPVAAYAEGPFLAFAERHPASRTRTALAGRLSQSLWPGLAVHGGYRLYTDTWGVLGHTADVVGAQTLLGDRLALRLDLRAYVQGPAAFHGDYTLEGGAVPGYRTADRRLGTMSDLTAGGSCSYSFPALGPLRLRAQGRVAHVSFRYDDELIPARDAWVAGLGLSAVF